MKKYSKTILHIRSDKAGDTIIEVLIAIAIAGFAIGITYATAERSLQQAITAKEHNEALNIVENQISDLQIRYQRAATASSFESQFGYANPYHHYCLNDSSTGPNDRTNQWAPYNNSNNLTQSSSLVTTSQGGLYNNKCTRPGGGFNYYIDIAVSQTTSTRSPSLFQVIVRWERIGGGSNNQASIYYKVDGSKG